MVAMRPSLGSVGGDARPDSGRSPRVTPLDFAPGPRQDRRVLVGRDREVEAIETLIREAGAGSSGVLAVVGEPGIGKSSLLDWAADNAAGMHVLRARGVQSEAHIPFAGLFELL